jgi:hypothetical protein
MINKTIDGTLQGRLSNRFHDSIFTEIFGDISEILERELTNTVATVVLRIEFDNDIRIQLNEEL